MDDKGKEPKISSTAEAIKKTNEDKMGLPEEIRAPHMYEAILSFLGIIIVMAIGIVVFGVDPHIPMFIGVIIAALISLKIGYKWNDIEGMMIHGISMAMQAILILCIVGMMIGVWLLSGTIPTMIYYGLKLLSPSIFLIAGSSDLLYYVPGNRNLLGNHGHHGAGADWNRSRNGNAYRAHCRSDSERFLFWR